MKTQSAKNKGRRLQQWVRDLMLGMTNLSDDDIQSRSMGAGGEDIMMSEAARRIFPISIECKNQERLNIYNAFNQAAMNSKNTPYLPVVIVKKNGQPPLAVMDAREFFEFYRP